MNLKNVAILICISLGTGFLYGQYQYHSGWNEGRRDLVQQQNAKAQAEYAKRITRQQQNDTRAAEADQQGAAKTEVITRDVIRYIKTPGRATVSFDADRVSIKRAAADNAACIPGFDDCAVRAGTSK